MYYDRVRNAYIDSESGAVVLQEDTGIELSDVYSQESGLTEATTEINSKFSPTIARPAGNSYTHLSKKRGIAPSPDETHLSDLEQDLYDLHVSGVDTVDPTTTGPSDRSIWDDWSLARTLQALEFEIPNEMIEGMIGFRN